MPDLRLRLHDSLTGQLVTLTPRRPDEVRVYTCGPTTYDVAHVGHARAALAPDILVRHLRGLVPAVVHVRNVTDVDDKILARAAETGEDPMALSSRMTALYQEDMSALGCLTPDFEPRVSEHVSHIIQFIELLLQKGAAYVVEMPNGARDVYYSVRAFPGYGKLSKRNVDDLQVGARVEASEHKKDPLDFALWKGCDEEGWGWDSPWGKGRPGWHIECSAMAATYLGHGFDIHTGGMDLIFPHHENEIAQSEAAHPEGAPFASIWMHNGFVNIDKEKMAKSLGNFVTVRDVLARNDAEALRYFLLTVHYRGPIAFDMVKGEDGRVTFPGVCEAERRLDYLYGTLERLRPSSDGPSDDQETLARIPTELIPFINVAKKARTKVVQALDDDLNTPVALSVVAEVAKSANELVDMIVQKSKTDSQVALAANWVKEMLADEIRQAVEPLGILQAFPEEYRERTQAQRLGLLGKTGEEIEATIQERAEARQAKDFARADAIRKELDGLKVELADSPTGTNWRIGI
jgi:cysteinyl-tRNA synthetase